MARRREPCMCRIWVPPGRSVGGRWGGLLTLPPADHCATALGPLLLRVPAYPQNVSLSACEYRDAAALTPRRRRPKYAGDNPVCCCRKSGYALRRNREARTGARNCSAVSVGGEGAGVVGFTTAGDVVFASFFAALRAASCASRLVAKFFATASTASAGAPKRQAKPPSGRRAGAPQEVEPQHDGLAGARHAVARGLGKHVGLASRHAKAAKLGTALEADESAFEASFHGLSKLARFCVSIVSIVSIIRALDKPAYIPRPIF
jgi:hypothetical protein